MPYSTRYYNRGSNYSGWLPPAVKWLLISNVAVFLLTFFAALQGNLFATRWFGLIPYRVFPGLEIWRLFTYLFLHDVRGFGHILFNMLALWMFGKDVESAWGTERFLKFYFLCGVVAGICVVVLNYVFGSPYSNTIGASGAIYGLLVVFGMMYPDVTVLFSFLFPIKAKYFVMIIGAITFLSSFQANGGVSNFAHLGGLVFGFVYMKAGWGAGARSYGRPGPFTTLRARYKQWQIDRAKRKFQVYMKKHGRGGPWVN
jgi:membrane associated rhomboid family serine protease